MGTSKKNEEEKRRGLDKRTPAQAAFEKMQEKRVRRVGRLGVPSSVGLGLPEQVLRKGWETETRTAPGLLEEGKRSERTLIPGRRCFVREEEPTTGELLRLSGWQKEELKVALKGARAGDPGLNSSAVPHLPSGTEPVTHCFPVPHFSHLLGSG